ncbi:response regulator transcription factor [Synechococcus sp. AH-603-L18]|nr:response regulator transcription factor [Synechococcus sp. AH-603-L18]MDB4338184.1 response regulator transcription factor [Synechococcus sp. AH-603-L18]
MPQETPARVLVVDDDPELLRFLIEELSGAGHQCVGCNNGQDALLRWRQESFDLVVLDWTLPDFSGMELCLRLRRSGNTTPVLMLTARDDVDERVQALDAGVDDYLTKPFNLKELHARVRARIRRGGYEQEARGEASGIALGGLVLDPIERRVQRGERRIDLSQREFELLLFLVRNADSVQSRQTILDTVWGAPFVGDPNTLDVYMGYLRKKVEAKGEAQLLHTVRGVGFMARVGEPRS